MHLQHDMSNDHRKLNAFNLADELTVSVYRATQDFAASEVYGLRSQIRRAAVSIPTNIVEGCARDTNREYARFLTIAFGSARELAYLLDLSRRLALMDAARVAPLLTLEGRVAAAITALKKSIRS